MSKDKGFHIVVTLADEQGNVLDRFTVVHPANTLLRAAEHIGDHITDRYQRVRDETEAS